MLIILQFFVCLVIINLKTIIKNEFLCLQFLDRRYLRSPSNQPGVDGLTAAFDQVVVKYEPHCLKNGGQKALDEFHVCDKISLS